MKKLTCRVKFYADTPHGDVNRLFSWKINSLNDVPACIGRFKAKGFRIRKIFFEYLDNSGKVVDNFVVPESVL